KEIVPTEGGRSDGLKDWCAVRTLRLLNRDLEIAPTVGSRDREKISMGFLSRSLFSRLISHYSFL
ncbi:MAG: hypothetical protein OXI86_08040, partial [Candidatus Poribacteria bacterium]|nr:hypothetical protein [Candidatus Poribacteria bacterium]